MYNKINIASIATLIIMITAGCVNGLAFVPFGIIAIKATLKDL